MARQADPELRQWWRTLIDSFDADRWTVAEFCRRHDVSTASFYSWRRRLRGRRASQESSEGPAFLPVQVCPEEPPAERSVQVHLPGGVRVDVPACEPELLLQLIAHVTPPSEMSS